MSVSNKKRLVLIGIHRKGEKGFKKTFRTEELEKCSPVRKHIANSNDLKNQSECYRLTEA